MDLSVLIPGHFQVHQVTLFLDTGDKTAYETQVMLSGERGIFVNKLLPYGVLIPRGTHYEEGQDFWIPEI